MSDLNQQLEKIASVELACGLATERGIDLSQVNFDQVSQEELYTAINQELEKTAESNAEKTYPISRALTHPGSAALVPIAGGAGLGGLGGLIMGALRGQGAGGKALGALKGLGRGAIVGGALGGLALSGPMAAGSAIGRTVNRRAIQGRINRGGEGLSDSERATLESAHKRIKESSASTSAFELIAIQRAQDWIDQQTAQEKTASAPQPTFDDYVNARAADILRANGYEV